MKFLLTILLCAFSLSPCHGTLLRLETVKQPLFIMGDGDSRIVISDVPYATYGSDPEWRFSAICVPCHPASEKPSLAATDVNLASLYKIAVSGTYKEGDSRDIVVTIDLSRAEVPKNYPFTIAQVADAVVTCVKLMYPPRPESEGKLEIKIVGGTAKATTP